MTDLIGIFLQTSDHSIDVATDFLTLADFYQLKCVSKGCSDALNLIEYRRCRDGKDYMVNFPGYPGVLVRPGAGLFRHQLASLHAMHKAENTNKSWGSLRGGILGDAPGLGKTITMLSHIANTAGVKPVEPKQFFNNDRIDEHWKLMRINIAFRVEILRSIKPFREFGFYEELADIVCPPYSDDRFPTLESFESFVNKETRKMGVPHSTIDVFRRNVIGFKAGMDKRDRRYFASGKGRRMMFERNLLPCSTTVIIVPDALLEHWAQQVRSHLNLNVFADSNEQRGSEFGVCYIDGVGDLSLARFPLNHKSTLDLPSIFDLIGYTIVVVPFSRIKQQFDNQRKRKKDESSLNLKSEVDYSSNSPLLQLRWFRIVVDEGHELGENPAGSDVTLFINEMASERRWVMSGTPTTGDEDDINYTSKGLDQLQRLLMFLRHEQYGIIPAGGGGGGPPNDDRSSGKKAQAKTEFVKQIKKPFLRKEEIGRKELYRVLDQVMVMHKKSDLNLPKPIFKVSEVDVRVPTVTQSAIISGMRVKNMDEATATLSRLGVLNRINQIMPYFKGNRKALFDTLLNAYMHTDVFQNEVDRSMGDYIVSCLRQQRIDLKRRGGAIVNTLAPLTAVNDSIICQKGWDDRRPIKAVVYSTSHNDLVGVAEQLYTSFDESNIAEMMQGKISSMAYELGRFRHGKKEGKFCPICNGWNEFTGQKLLGCHKTLLEVEDSDGNIFLIEQERIHRAVSRNEYQTHYNQPWMPKNGQAVDTARMGQDVSLTRYGVSVRHWRVNDVLCINGQNEHPLLQSRWSQQQWRSYGADQCRRNMQREGYEGRDNYFGPIPNRNEDLNYKQLFVKLRKWQRCGTFHSRPNWNQRRNRMEGYYSGPTLEDVEISAQKEDTFILLLDASLATGLDLSFVTHIFLLEPIDDAALLEQVVSRAHRLGCQGPVIVDTIHTWPKLDPTTEAVAKQLKSASCDETNKKLSQSICDHCYRSFPTLEIAEEHELTCERNPSGNAVVDPFHLSSVYRDIKPPPPLLVGETREDAKSSDPEE